jgi:N-acetylglucosamine malate deacetylase 1
MVTSVDLLVFGPHPDDIEIGLGGVVARHVDLGFRVGLCDLTAGEMGSNGTSRSGWPKRRPHARCSARPGASISAGPIDRSAAPNMFAPRRR